MYKFGISMRITEASGYEEPRDSIAMDWSRYMLKAFPDSQFMFIPNIEEDVIKYAEDWGINVLILTGGDDLGVYSIRDKTETILLEYALKANIPIVAICRGLQLVHTYFGGKLLSGDKDFADTHRATKHLTNVEDSIREVNSYHTNYIDKETVSTCFDVFATCKKDGTIEGLRNNQILAMMWHPERDTEVSTWNKLLIKDFLDNGK